MPIFSAIAAPLIGGVVSSVLGGDSEAAASQAADRADPFAKYRDSYAQMLNRMMGVGTPSPSAYQQDVGPEPQKYIQGGFWDNPTEVLNPEWVKWDERRKQIELQNSQMQNSPTQTTGGGFDPMDPSYQWRFNQGMNAVLQSNAARGMLNSGNTLSDLVAYGQNMASTEYANQFKRLADLAGVYSGSPGQAASIMNNNAQSDTAALNSFGASVGNAVVDWYNNNNQPAYDGGVWT